MPNADNLMAAAAQQAEIKNLADLLTMPVNIMTRDGGIMQNVTVIDWNNSYGIICRTVSDFVPYFCFIPIYNISQICRKSNA